MKENVEIPHVKRGLAVMISEAERSVIAKAKRLACSSGYKNYGYILGRREVYGVDHDSGDLLALHRTKLRVMLKSLMEQRRWAEASGIVGILLGIPVRRDANSRRRSISDYRAGTMVLRRLEDTQAGAMRCRRMFRLLTRLQLNARFRGEIQLESALFLIDQGDREAAYNELRSIADSRVFHEDPVVNLCHGLNTHCLWYEAAMEENSEQIVREMGRDRTGRSLSPQEVIDETEVREPPVDMSSRRGRYSRGETHEGSVVSRDSFRDQSMGEPVRQSTEIVASAWDESQLSLYEETNEEGFVEDGEQVWWNAKVILSEGLDPRLFPIRVIPHPNRQNQHYRVLMNNVKTRDLHTTAVKHLKQSLRSAPDMLPALLPLVQLLLAVDDVKGAAQEINRCAQALKNHVMPPSLKALLLESLEYIDYSLLEACYQKVLSLNPFATWALTGLANMHSTGRLKSEVLLDSIALHLDAMSGSVVVWQKLSSSLLDVGMASRAITKGPRNTDTSKDGDENMSMLSREYFQRLWCSPRHEFWLKKHFSAEVMEKHHQSLGDTWLLAYKAACAAHIYGPEFHVVEKVCRDFEGKREDVLLKLVGRHRKKSLKLFAEQYNQ